MDPLVKTQSHEDYSNGNVQENPHKRGGRRKTSIEYIENKSRRHATFSQRKSGIIKKESHPTVEPISPKPLSFDELFASNPSSSTDDNNNDALCYSPDQTSSS
ncbi:unnamed protein product [Absidia cylindrospora]